MKLELDDKISCIRQKIFNEVFKTEIKNNSCKNCEHDNKYKLKLISLYNSLVAAYAIKDIKKINFYINYIDNSISGYCIPIIKNFRLAFPEYVNANYLDINIAYFDLVNLENIEPNSLKIIHIDDNNMAEIVIAQNLPVSSPANFPQVVLPVLGGQTYKFKAQVTDTQGNTHDSNIYSVTVNNVIQIKNFTPYSNRDPIPHKIYSDESYVINKFTINYEDSLVSQIVPNSGKLIINNYNNFTDTVLQSNLPLSETVNTRNHTISGQILTTAHLFVEYDHINGTKVRSSSYTFRKANAPIISRLTLYKNDNILTTIPVNNSTIITKATFNLTNNDEIEWLPNTFHLIDSDNVIKATLYNSINGNSYIWEFNEPIRLIWVSGKTYTFKIRFKDKNGKYRYSNSVNIVCQHRIEITNFKVNIPNTIYGSQNVNISQATFNINDTTNVVPNSLKIIRIEE